MKTEIVHSKIVLDIRREKSNTNYPLKLRITFKRIRKYYSIGISTSKEDWEKISYSKSSLKYVSVKNKIASIEAQAKIAIDKVLQLNSFSFIEFENLFFQTSSNSGSVVSCFNSYITKLKNNDQYGSASAYQTALNALLRYKKSLAFSDITIEFLMGFEKYLLYNNKSITTVGIYMRHLRSIINLAIENGFFLKENYPFGRRRYNIPSGKNIKKSLTPQELKMVFNYKAVPFSTKEKAIDFWKLSYLCNGINIMDIAKLTWANLTNTLIIFTREKTKRTNRNSSQPIQILRNESIDKLIDKWKSQNNNNKSDLVFSIISIYDSEENKRKKVQQFTKLINKYLKELGLELGFDLKLTTYVARHSFATMIVQNGAPLEFASLCLGHTNITTTQRYFAGFDLKAHKEFTKALTNF